MPWLKTHTPYTDLASLYDALLGNQFFSHLRYTFERLVRCYDIRFASAADVACGTGQFVNYLWRRGVPIVYGVDRSPAMLRVAAARNRGNRARFLCQDFMTLELPEPVDLITCNFDSLNYLLTAADLLRVLCRFRASLKLGGYAIFDMITNRPSWGGSLQPYVEHVTQPGLTFVRVSRWDPERSLQVARITISRYGRIQQEIHRQRGYPVATVVGLIAQAGFTLRGMHDFYTLNLITPYTTRAVYVVLKRFNDQPDLKDNCLFLPAR